MRVLIIGGGGREHTLAWKIARSPLLGRLYCAPGNAGIAALARCVDLPPEDLEGLCNFALEQKIDLTVVGPEAPLAAGL
ncbi:MAG: phosphoribosylamine--glycine ligase, partial [Firmicutes bacterium]|nr:phosphoribosylamine--glycine ligase [Bacillota bacterium]